MIDFQDIERVCCTTDCTGVAQGICPYFGKEEKLNKCERIRRYIEEVEDGEGN